MDTICYQWGILYRLKLKLEMIGFFFTKGNHKFDTTIEEYERFFFLFL